MRNAPVGDHAFLILWLSTVERQRWRIDNAIRQNMISIPNLQETSMKLIFTLLAFSAAAVMTANAFAQAPIVIKFSHVVATDTPKGKAAERFKELAEKATKGRVKVEVYPNSTLYKDKEEMEALQLGAVQMLAPALAKFGPLGVKEFEVFDLPYIFPSKDVLYRVTEGPIGKKLFQKLESKGITGLAFWDNGFK